MRAAPVPPVFAEREVGSRQTLVVRPLPLVCQSVVCEYFRDEIDDDHTKKESHTVLVAKAHVEHELIDGILFLAQANHLVANELELVVVLEEQEGSVERQLAVESFRVDPRQLLPLAGYEYARAVVKDTARHAFWRFPSQI